MFNHPQGRNDIVFQFVLLAFFYVNYYVLLDKFYFQKKYVVYFSIVLIAVFITIPVTERVVLHTIEPPLHHPHIRPPHLRGNAVSMFLFNRKLYLFLLVTFVSLFVKTRNRMKVIEQEQRDTELSFLKAQINPHFLFNTLNSIYSLAIHKSDQTANAVVKLSSMMRYILNEAQQELVSLQREADYIIDFIELQKLRISESVKLDISINGDFNQYRVAPLILITFIENAFKYGVNSEENSQVSIHINITNGTLDLMVKNNKVHTSIPHDSKTKVGLINVKKRLDLLYPGKHSLEVIENDTEYFVHLLLKLND